jgi:hypothetical protein
MRRLRMRKQNSETLIESAGIIEHHARFLAAQFPPK